VSRFHLFFQWDCFEFNSALARDHDMPRHPVAR